MTTINIREHDNVVTLQIVGKFNFECLADFSSAVLTRDFTGASSLILDLGQVEYLDSSALGVLIALRRKLPASTTTMITHCNSSVRDTLAVARFDQLFDIS